MTAPNYNVDPVGQHIFSRVQGYNTAATFPASGVFAVPANGIIVDGGTAAGGTVVQVFVDGTTLLDNGFRIRAAQNQTVFIPGIKINRIIISTITTASEGQVTLLF